jgi:hypothetical protein
VVVSIAQDVILAALARSSKNQSTYLATNASELLSALNRSLRGAYAIASRVSPEYVGVIVAVTGVSGVWARPAAAEQVWWVEKTNGTEVAVVPPSERAAEAGRPSVYRIGRNYYTVGRTVPVADPTPTEVLNFYAAMRPAALATITDALPATWDDAYDNLLVLDLALYLALKDGRLEELGALRTERQAWLSLYVNFVATESTVLRRRFNLPAPPALPELSNLLLVP